MSRTLSHATEPLCFENISVITLAQGRSQTTTKAASPIGINGQLSKRKRPTSGQNVAGCVQRRAESCTQHDVNVEQDPASNLAELLQASQAPPRSKEALDERLEPLATRRLQLPPPLDPAERRPVVSLGAGSIIKDGHGPAYCVAGLDRLAIFDKRPEAAQRMAEAFGYDHPCSTLRQAVELGRDRGALFDVALPPEAIMQVLPQLPEGSAVLIQKPLGKTLDETARIVELCGARRLCAGVNFQLPFSPQIVAAFEALRRGVVGKLTRARVDLDLRTEWSTWEFILREPRVEVLLHSIHYLSLFGYFFGEPQGVRSTQRGDPDHRVLKDRDVCSSTRLDYALGDGGIFTAEIECNHLSRKPRAQWRSELVLDGTEGRIVAKIADNLDYPNGVDDELTLEHATFGRHRVALVGNRFPMAFVATTTHLLRAAAGNRPPTNSLALGALAMRLAESCYDSNEKNGTTVPVAPLLP